jgi:3-oxoacyl-[acyl-carrier protein] reductase
MTGAARGIGAAAALELAKQGADVAISYRQSHERADDLVEAISRGGR